MAKMMHKNKSNLESLTRSLPRESRALLSWPISALTPRIETAGFDNFFAKLQIELKAKQINHLKIEAYFGDEWFCPDQTTAIAIPFWLADERLKKIERTIIGFVEGEKDQEFMQLLRHEAGHCIEHAYKLSRRMDWRGVFGNPDLDYDPDSVKTVPGHPDYVVNLPGWYAQTHPEEDFAETFAVWLDPDSNWENVYRNSPVVLRKLKFVTDVCQDIALKKPRRLSQKRIFNARRMRRTLKSYYEERLLSVHRQTLNL